MATFQYPWENTDPSTLLKQIASGVTVAQALTGDDYIGAQNMGAINKYISEKLLPFYKQQVEQQTSTLKAINPAFDPQKYLADVSLIYDAGGGSAANKAAAAVRAGQQIQSYEMAVQRAQQAATKYQQTGKIDPYPDSAQIARDTLQKVYKGTLDSKYTEKYVNQLKSGVADADKAVANAAAARVGAPLPYPTSTIGEIAGGGLFQTAAQATQAYTNGQLNQAGQNIANSNSAANSQNNQVTNTADGKFQWNGQTYPTKDAAAQAAAQLGVTSLKFSDGTTLNPGTPNPNTGTPSGTTTGSNPTANNGTPGGTSPANVIDPAAQKASIDILNKYLNDGTIDSGTYQFFKAAVDAWNPDQQVDYANILNTFEGIKNNDINPHFKEMSDLFINDLQNNRQYLQDTNALEVQQNADQAIQMKETMQKNLAQRGMMFTGEAVKQLGDQSVFAVEGTPQAAASAIPTIQPFAGQGQLQKQTQAASSSAQLRYEKSLKDLAQQAEATLGTAGSAGLIPGTTQIGGITGSLVEQKQAQQANALNDLYKQQQNNVEAQKPQKVFSE